MKRAVAFIAAALVLAILGLSVFTATRVNVVWFRGRVHVLRFGPVETLGTCRTSETADPNADVLCNLIDSDADGKPDWRTCASFDATRGTCERRVVLGFWASATFYDCEAAVERCHR